MNSILVEALLEPLAEEIEDTSRLTEELCLRLVRLWDEYEALEKSLLALCKESHMDMPTHVNN